MRIIDCFTFFNEIDILKIRLEEIYETVDEIVLVESIYTHAGKIKELVFDKNKNMFEKYNNKIKHIIVKDMPNTANPWDNERFQRQCIWRGLENIQNGDVILISDADEIPKAEKIIEMKTKGFNQYNVFQQKLYYMYFNAEAGSWNGTKSFIYNENENKNIDLTEEIRYKKNIPNYDQIVIQNAGWHFSYIGNVKKIQEKIKAFAHQELNIEKITNEKRIKMCMKNNVDPVHKGKLEIKKIDETFPKYLRDNIKIYQKYIKG